MKEIDNYLVHEPASGGAPKQLVILLHGLGANGQDLISLAPFFARTLPDALFVAPDAPFPCDMAPSGFQWFSVQDWRAEAFIQGVQTAAPVLDSFISDMMAEHNIPADKVALVGFSQGAMMSLYVAPRFPEKIAGVLGYSGSLVWEEDADADKMNKMPIHLIHGDADPIVDVAGYYKAREVLSDAGFKVSGHVTEGLMHGIDEAGVESGGAFLKKVFSG